MRLRSLRIALALFALVSIGMMLVLHWQHDDQRKDDPSNLESIRNELRALRRLWQRKRTALVAFKRNGTTLPYSQDFLKSVPGLVDTLILEEDKRLQASCDWIHTQGWDLFRNTCDQAAFEVDKKQSLTQACADACDATENGACKAWTAVGVSCFLKACSEHSPRKVKVVGAISAIRRDDARCGRLRRWVTRTTTLEWLSRWRKVYGESETFLTHKRKSEDSVRFGPLVTIRGERHSGTNWVRAILTKNCIHLAHRLSPSLDSEGVYAWKHGLAPKNWSPHTKDIMVVLIRSAATWVPKMRRVAYNGNLDSRKTKNLAAFLDLAFIDNYSTQRYANVLDMRAAKYRDYQNLARRCPGTVLAVRYEDLLMDGGAFLIRKLRHILPDQCGGGDDTRTNFTFNPVTNYAKFGSVSSLAAKKPNEDTVTWTFSDWSALLHKLDADLETNLGYRYSSNSPGNFEVIDPSQPTWLTLPFPSLLSDTAGGDGRERIALYTF